jgi:hypothetical protein
MIMMMYVTQQSVIFSAIFYIDYVGLLNFVLNTFGSIRSLQKHIALYYVIPQLNFYSTEFILQGTWVPGIFVFA